MNQPAGALRPKTSLPPVVLVLWVMEALTLVLTVMTVVQKHSLEHQWVIAHHASFTFQAPRYVPVTVGALVLLGIVGGAASGGILTRQRWGLITALVAAGIGILFALIMFIQSRPTVYIILGVFQILLALGVCAAAIIDLRKSGKASGRPQNLPNNPY